MFELQEASNINLYLNGGRTTMDRVSENLLNEFSSERGLSHLPEDKRFEHFVAFITIGQHFGNAFDTEEVLVGAAAGIDAIATIINGNLVTDAESIEESYGTDELDVTFVIVQADRGANFDTGKIGTFGYAAVDFFSDQPKLPRNDQMIEAARIMAEVYNHSSKFTRGNPICRLYFATTGKIVEDQTLNARKSTVVSDLEATNLFREVTFNVLGADSIQRLYRQTRNAISREFIFDRYVIIPALPEITGAYIGFLPVKEFIRIISDDNGEIIPGLFRSNPRDWLDYNKVNSEIKNTLTSDAKSRFVLMNNGITIIAREVRSTSSRFFISDYQIVNGCQTSHILIEQADKNDESIMVPVRLIGTKNEDVIKSIIRATNRQTEVSEDQFFALEEFPRQLEEFFKAFPLPQRLYYECRSRQYERDSIEKTRVITQANVIRSFAAMFLNEPHRTTRNFAALKAKVGKQIFGKEHRKEPYYTAAFALYKLEYLFRGQRLEPKFKPARYHILLAMRLLGNPGSLPQVNSHDMMRYCETLIEILSDSNRADELIGRAVKAVDFVAAGDFQRDTIRTEPFTEKVIEYCKNENKASTEVVK